MMIFLEEHWLELVVGLVLLFCMLYGHYRGFFRIAVSMLALLITLYVVDFALPYVTTFFKENTQIQESLSQIFLNGLNMDVLYEDEALTANTQQALIEELDIPSSVKKILSNNNNAQMWEMLGVDKFADYVSSYLSNMIFNVLGFIVLFIVVWILLHLLMRVTDIFAKLPIIHGLNQIAGAVVGLAQGIFYVWIAFLVIIGFSGTIIGQALLYKISESIFLQWIFKLNVLVRFLNM